MSGELNPYAGPQMPPAAEGDAEGKKTSPAKRPTGMLLTVLCCGWFVFGIACAWVGVKSILSVEQSIGIPGFSNGVQEMYYELGIRMGREYLGAAWGSLMLLIGLRYLIRPQVIHLERSPRTRRLVERFGTQGFLLCFAAFAIQFLPTGLDVIPGWLAAGLRTICVGTSLLYCLLTFTLTFDLRLAFRHMHLALILALLGTMVAGVMTLQSIRGIYGELIFPWVYAWSHDML
jgi:hypothetical protein